jgi:hypothetical protein
MIGLDYFVGSTATTLTTVFDVVHPVGEGVLSAFGAGAIAKPLGEWEKRGIEETMTPAEKAKKAKAEKEAAAKAEAAKKKDEAKAAAAEKAKPSRFWWWVGGGAAVVVAALLLRGRK